VNSSHSCAANDLPIACDRVVHLWNEICSSVLPAVETLNDFRRRHIKARCREAPKKKPRDEGWWRAYFELVMSSAFLRGEASGETWRGATFDWVIRPTNMPKVLEGHYADKQRRRGAADVDWDKEPD